MPMPMTTANQNEKERDIPVCPITQGDKVGSCNDEAVTSHIVCGRLAGYVGLGIFVCVPVFLSFLAPQVL